MLEKTSGYQGQNLFQWLASINLQHHGVVIRRCVQMCLTALLTCIHGCQPRPRHPTTLLLALYLSWARQVLARKPPAPANMLPPNRAESTWHISAEADVWSAGKLCRAKPLWSQAIKSISSFQYYQLKLMILPPVSSVRVRFSQNSSACLGELLSSKNKVCRLVPMWQPKGHPCRAYGHPSSSLL